MMEYCPCHGEDKLSIVTFCIQERRQREAAEHHRGHNGATVTSIYLTGYYRNQNEIVDSFLVCSDPGSPFR